MRDAEIYSNTKDELTTDPATHIVINVCQEATCIYICYPIMDMNRDT